MPQLSSPLNIVFFGTPEFAAVGLRALFEMSEIAVGLVITQPDRPAGRGAKVVSQPVKILATEHKIETYQPLSLKRELDQALVKISAHGPFDLGVVIAFGQILPQAILDIPKLGCINVHGSILPRWRGAAPIQRAIMAGDTETGVALMKMEAGLDTGAVFAETRIMIGEYETFGELHDRLALAGGELLKSKLVEIAHGRVAAVPQSEVGLTYASKIKNEEAQIDWSRSCQEITRLICALSPVPGAFSTLNGKRLKIFSAIPHPERLPSDPVPGTLVLSDGSGYQVVCGSGTIEILELQLEGKRRMPIAEFIRGAGDALGGQILR